MPVDIHDILHVLAHELRTPVGIAHGYVRLLLEDRLPLEADRRRALEQTQKALTRITELSNEATALAAWYERETSVDERARARSIVDHVMTAVYEWPVTVDVGDVPDDVLVRTKGARILGEALVDVVRATARELRGQQCTVAARVDDHRLEILAGPVDALAALRAGPNATSAGPLSLERGGLGLSLLHAAVILDAHNAERWAITGLRQTAGVRLPLEERPQQ